jgi:hypothetical protein
MLWFGGSLEATMATRIEAAARDLHDEDVHAWALDQAALLRAGRLETLDVAHLIEEVEDLVGALRGSVRSRARTIIEHFLKLQHSPATGPRPGWRATIRAQRGKLLDILTPSLRGILEDELDDLYARARTDAQGALRDHGEDVAADALPARCPYTADQIIGGWLP